MKRQGIDLAGQRFGRLTVKSEAPSRPTKRSVKRYWNCICDCGQERQFPTGNLTSGNTSSCGCKRKEPAANRKDLTGRTFDRLTAISPAPSRNQYGTVVGYWNCKCVCGTELQIPTGNLLSGNSKSCGCLNDEARIGNRRAETHGLARTPTYISWQAMHKRCDEERPRYGGRGIAVDPRWDRFEDFLADMGERPDGTTIDRIDNDGPYAPDNCRWATGYTQGNNRANNHHITYGGRTQTIAEWAREVGLTNGVLYNRIAVYKWDLQRALTEPVHRR